MKPSEIVAVTAMQTSTDVRNPAVKVTVTTADGKQGSSSSFEGYSASDYRPSYLYDYGKKYLGNGVTTAVSIIENIIAPAIIGMDAAKQGEVDCAIKGALDAAGVAHCVNITNPVSLAVLKAAAQSLQIPLYRHIGGCSAFTLPYGGYRVASGSKRYWPDNKSQSGPVYNLVSYGFDSFADAHYALWEAANAYEALLAKRLGILVHRGFSLDIPAGRISSDRELLDMMVEGIEKAGHTGKIGIHIDVGAGMYYDPDPGVYRGLFDAADKTPDELFAYYEDLIADYPVVILQDPFDQHDMERHSALLERTGIEIAGQELCGSDPERIKECIDAGCVNAVVLSVCSFETFSDVVGVVRYAKNRAVDIIPQNRCGEGLDVAHFAVGFRTGAIYQGGIDTVSNQLLAMEQEIGPRARFYGENGLKGGRFGLRKRMIGE